MVCAIQGQYCINKLYIVFIEYFPEKVKLNETPQTCFSTVSFTESFTLYAVFVATFAKLKRKSEIQNVHIAMPL